MKQPKYINLPGSKIDESMPFGGSSANNKLEADYTDAWTEFQANDTPATRQAMLQQIQPVVDRAVYSYARGAGPAVKSRAKLMALDALKTYKPDKGNLKTHIMSQLQGLQRIAGQQNQIIQLPVQVALDRNKLQTIEEQLYDELGRYPSDAELANKTGLSLKRLRYVRDSSPGINTGGFLDEEGDTYSPASKRPGDTAAADAWADMVYADLSPMDQAIMDHSWGRNGRRQMDNREIANRLGVSPGAISQRKNKIQKMLDSRFNPFKDI